MEVAIVAWILSGIISAVSASNNGRCTLSEFFIFLLLGPLGSARTPRDAGKVPRASQPNYEAELESRQRSPGLATENRVREGST